MRAPVIYGTLPINLGQLDFSPTEMMFWLYCPIKMAGERPIIVPDNLKQFWPIIEACWENAGDEVWRERYVYLTAKTLWVNHENPGQRRGWHCDGFMTDDLNYIWCDSHPTLFAAPESLVGFTQEHTKALEEIDALAEVSHQFTYPVRNLLRLDQTVIHRVADFEHAGLRTFVKLSVSRHPYNLVGNSINHRLATGWTYAGRQAERNPEVAATP